MTTYVNIGFSVHLYPWDRFKRFLHSTNYTSEIAFRVQAISRNNEVDPDRSTPMTSYPYVDPVEVTWLDHKIKADPAKLAKQGFKKIDRYSLETYALTYSDLLPWVILEVRDMPLRKKRYILHCKNSAELNLLPDEELDIELTLRQHREIMTYSPNYP